MKHIETIYNNPTLTVQEKINCIASQVQNQEIFDWLFLQLYNPGTSVAQVTCGVLKNVALNNPGYFTEHIPNLIISADILIKDYEKEMLAFVLPKLIRSTTDEVTVFIKLSDWTLNSAEKIPVRAACIQGLGELVSANSKFSNGFLILTAKVKLENIPHLNKTMNNILCQLNLA